MNNGIKLPLVRIEHYRREGDELDTFTEDKWEMYSEQARLTEDNGHKIELIWEDRGDGKSGWVMRVYSEVSDNQTLYEAAKEEVKGELVPRSNKIGRTWEDEEGGLLYG